MLKPKFLPAILISLAKKYSVSLIAKCRAKFCRGRCPDQLCKVPNLLSCCNLAVLPCKIGIGAPIPRFSDWCGFTKTTHLSVINALVCLH
ncbi:14247_t:CDS:2 [Rhizophagus irregularis]|nr:14247_t:CDS:2 [Rhizophagus irregularis]